jgi:hypothetical protein
MKLYLWRDVFNVEYGGIAFAVAESVEAARDVIASKGEAGFGVQHDRLAVIKELEHTQPEVHDLPAGFYFSY